MRGREHKFQGFFMQLYGSTGFIPKGCKQNQKPFFKDELRTKAIYMQVLVQADGIAHAV